MNDSNNHVCSLTKINHLFPYQLSLIFKFEDNLNNSTFMRSKENDIDMYELQTKYRNFRLKQEEKQKELENSFNFNQSFDSVSSPMKFYLKNPINRSSQYNFINNIHNKMNTMKVNSSLKKKFFEYFKNNLF